MDNHQPQLGAHCPRGCATALVPIVAGADKFLNLLVDWKIYLPHFVTQMVPVDPSLFMKGVGIIEIVAGLLVPTIAPASEALWSWRGWCLLGLMAAIAGFRDVFVRDVVMAVGVIHSQHGRGIGWARAALAREACDRGSDPACGRTLMLKNQVCHHARTRRR